ncbi:MAG TPA: tetratricopeptide repeat protein [Acidobacteriota bacterium]
MKKQSTYCALKLILMAVLLAGGQGLSWAAAVPSPAMSMSGQGLTARIIEARAKLQEGWTAWQEEAMKTGRDMFLKLVLEEKSANADLCYYLALSDHRLIVYAFAAGKTAEAAPLIAEARKYLEKAIELDPGRGELYAMQATVLGYEIVLDQQKGMELGMQIMMSFAQAESKEPDNPRISLLKGESLMFWPVEYGGGPDNAIAMLDRSLALFEKEKVIDPVKPSWGKEEAYAFLGRAYAQKGARDKAVEYMKKALETSPDFRLAQDELKKLQAEK